MEITSSPRSADRVPGFPRKPLDNPPRPKPTYASDEECARLLGEVLRRVPESLGSISGVPFPLLTALERLEAWDGADLARQLLFIAAASHRNADERFTAEYLLRNRHAVASKQRSVLSLLLAARCAAEMDLRRIRPCETSTPHDTLATRPAASVVSRVDDPSVGDMVVHKLNEVVGDGMNTVTQDRILDAVVIAIALSERHAMNGGTGPSLLGMRTDARPESRLITHLRAAFDDDVVARNIARLLVGPDGTPIDTALLWWCSRPNLTASDVPLNVRTRWTRYLRAAQAAVHIADSYPQVGETRASSQCLCI